MKDKYVKGFTLVELAIVLIVIGLLLGMAFKGKTLIDAARVKADIARISKVSTALNTYYSKFNTIPGIKPDGTITSKSIYDELLKQSMLKQGDFKISMYANTHLAFAPCEHGMVSTNKGPVSRWRMPGNGKLAQGTNICIYPDSRLPDSPEMDKPASLAGENYASSYFICNVETALDNSNMDNGDGRLLHGGVSSNALIAPGNYKLGGDPFDCSQYKHEKDIRDKNKSSSYSYRVF